LSAYGPPAPAALTYLAITNGENAVVTPPPAQQAAPQQAYGVPPQQVYQYYSVQPPAYALPAHGAPVQLQPQNYYASPSYDDAPAQPNVVSPPEELEQQLSMYEDRSSPTSVVAEKPSEMEKALQSLVNLEDITVAAESPEKYKLTMKKEEEKKKSKKSQGLPPTAPAWHLGTQASLSDVQANKAERSPTKDVMRTHAFDPAAAHVGMMVVYGQPQQQGPPPIQHNTIGTGFGVGAQMAYAAHQPYYRQAYSGAAF
jgi:hypothetical protein